MRTALGLLMLALSLSGCGASTSPATAPAQQASHDADAVDPGAQPWERVPRDQVAAVCGLDPALLEAAEPQLAATPYTIIRYGRMCWSGGYPTGTTTPYQVWSETKTFGAILFGMIASRSGLDDTDPVTEWIPPEELGAINPAATLAHVLAMTSTSPDLAPGKKTAWSYDTTGDREINKLVAVMNRAIAREPEAFPGVTTVKEFAEKELFAPLGMTQSTWPGEIIGSTLQSSVEDMSRLGLLMLRKGRWNGRQLLDESFVYRMTHPAFEDTNTGYGYLTQMNAEQNWTYSTGTADLVCAPYTTWPEYPHAPFYESADDNGGSPFEGGHDIGVFWAAGTGGQKMSVHRALDLVIAVRDDAVDAEGDVAGGEGAFEGHKRVWRLIRPALVALDPVYAGDEAGFCAAYQRSAYAPDFSPWSEGASQ
jgi:CubicO group peptidase (beta-lactamase class C family)